MIQLLLLSPNPFTTTTTLSLQGAYHNPTLFIYNLLGQEVRSIPVGTNKQITIPRNQLPVGMYFYKLIEDNKEVLGTGKMIIE
ncbi:MAG: T9SS type A sorting domain-containing protein [Bacteroidota bacterium]